MKTIPVGRGGYKSTLLAPCSGSNEQYVVENAEYDPVD